MHDNSDMIIHVLVDVAQKDTRQDGDAAERNTGQVNVLVTLGVCDLAGQHDHLVRGLVTGDSRDLFDPVEETCCGELDGLGNVGGVCDAQLQRHGAADVLDGVRGELVDKHIIVHGVANAPANDTDRERQRRDRGDDVVGADDGRHDTRGHDDAADAQSAEDQETPERGQVEAGATGQCTAPSRHEDGREDHEFAVMAAEHGQQPQHNTRAREDAEADGDTAHTDADGVVSVDVEGLRRPEHDDAEEVGARDGRDDQRERQDAGFLLHARREHGELGELDLPDGEQDEEEHGADDQRGQHVRVAPFVLVPAPLETGEEEDHADDGESAADKVDFANDFLPAQTAAVWARRGEVEEESPAEADTCPDAAEQGAIPPAGVGRDELGPEHGWAEWDDGEHQDRNVFASFTSWGQLRGDG